MKKSQHIVKRVKKKNVNLDDKKSQTSVRKT